MSQPKELAVKVENLTKRFHIPLEAHSGLKQKLINTLKGRKGYREFTPLKDISFEIEKGDFFGIVGRNGSGKSTLLKTLAGIYNPDNGAVHVNGTLVPFIELGVGFNPELTGRENVFLNGALLGFSRKQMEEMYDDIVDFAELHDFMEERLKNYSSGMQVRLAFSIAIRAEGDVLLLDEVLAVGDEAFQKKCFNYFSELKRKKKTVILVSHDMESVRRFCNKAILIENGSIKVSGSPSDVASQYSLDNLNADRQPAEGDAVEETEDTSRKNVKKVSLTHPITSLEIIPRSPLVIDRNKTFTFDVIYNQLDDTPVYVGIGVLYQDIPIMEHGSVGIEPVHLSKTKRKVTYHLPLSQFTQGKLKINATIIGGERSNRKFYAFTTLEGACEFMIKEEGRKHGGILIQKGSWEV